jgi:hypothetical protein
VRRSRSACVGRQVAADLGAWRAPGDGDVVAHGRAGNECRPPGGGEPNRGRRPLGRGPAERGECPCPAEVFRRGFVVSRALTDADMALRIRRQRPYRLSSAGRGFPRRPTRRPHSASPP